MSAIFFIQVIVSFVIGGSVVTLLSLLAEKTNEHLSGIIMMFPSTIVLGFFFLGLSTSAAQVALVVPATLIPIGMVPLSSPVYIHFSERYARLSWSKYKQIVAAWISSSLVWMILALPFAIWKFNNPVIGLAGYFGVAALAHYLLHRKKLPEKLPVKVYSKTQILLRAMLSGSIIATVVVLSKTLGPFWGAVFTMYPAVTFASLIIFHFHYQPSQLFFLMKKAPLGSVLLLVYALSAMWLFPKFGIVYGTVFSYAICLVFSILLIRYQKRSLLKA